MTKIVIADDNCRPRAHMTGTGKGLGQKMPHGMPIAEQGLRSSIFRE
jgi:hypothetical protein